MLCCTRTLAAGVNLPARRVIFRSLKGWPEQVRARVTLTLFLTLTLTLALAPAAALALTLALTLTLTLTLTEQLGGTSKWDALLRVNDYRQMAGRAGRAGLADYGESILVVAGARQRAAATSLLASATEPMRSCLSRDSEGGYLTLTLTLALTLTLTLTLSLTLGIPKRRAASRSS